MPQKKMNIGYTNIFELKFRGCVKYTHCSLLTFTGVGVIFELNDLSKAIHLNRQHQ